MNYGGRQRAAQRAYRTVWVLALVVWINASAANAQTAAISNYRSEKILREINDPPTGQSWLLIPSSAVPAGPGRWVRSENSSCLKRKQEKEQEKPVIRRGDRVLVEEHSAMVDAVWEATAMAPAQAGSELQVRLKIGGRLVRAVAVARGRAEVRR